MSAYTPSVFPPRRQQPVKKPKRPVEHDPHPEHTSNGAHAIERSSGGTSRAHHSPPPVARTALPPPRITRPPPSSTTATDEEGEVDDLLQEAPPVAKRRKVEERPKGAATTAPPAQRLMRAPYSDMPQSEYLRQKAEVDAEADRRKKLYGPYRGGRTDQPTKGGPSTSSSRAPTASAQTSHPSSSTTRPPSHVQPPPSAKKKTKKDVPSSLAGPSLQKTTTPTTPVKAEAEPSLDVSPKSKLAHTPTLSSPPRGSKIIGEDPGPSDTWDLSILCWNVRGLAEMMQDDSLVPFFDLIDFHRPEILVLTDHRVRPDLDMQTSGGEKMFRDRGYRRIWWNNAPHEWKHDRGALGVVVMSKCADLPYKAGILDGDGLAGQGRFLQVEFDSFVLVAALFHSVLDLPLPMDPPEAHDAHRKRVAARAKFHRAMGKAVASVDRAKPLILTGSLETDLDHVSLRNTTLSRDGFLAGFALAKIFDAPNEKAPHGPLVDVATRFYGPAKIEKDVYEAEAEQPGKTRREWTHSYEAVRTGRRIEQRLDGFIISPRLLPRVRSYRVLDAEKGISSACRPVLLELKALDEE